MVNSTYEIKSSEVNCLLLRVSRTHGSDSSGSILPTLGPVNLTPRDEGNETLTVGTPRTRSDVRDSSRETGSIRSPGL